MTAALAAASAGHRAPATPRLVAHRGLHDEAAGGARENTLAAVREAVEAGAAMVEVDIRVTRDGAVVLLHDATLTRLWGDPRAVRDIGLGELRELGGGQRRVPLLAEALDLLRGTDTTLLIDMDGPEPAPAAVEAVRVHEDTTAAPARTAWCGEAGAMRVVRELLPTAEIWMPWSSARPPAAADLAAIAPAVVNVPYLLVGEEFVATVHELGARVSCWTVDEPVQVAHLAAIGVDSVTTNRLPEAQRALVDAPSCPPRARELVVAREIAGHAATATAQARAEGFGTVDTKTGPADHVTEVDRAIERAAREVLGAQFPDHGVVGEEYGGSESSACWFLDPVDGTANLVGGLPWTSFSLALVEEGRPVVGAVLDPLGPTPVTATAGGGAWRAGRRLRVSPGEEGEGEDPLSGVIVSTELAGAQAWPGLHGLLDRLAARHAILRIPGSGTATLAGVALGRGAAAIIHRYSPLDHAAAVLIVAEAGGAVLDASGEPNPHPVGGAVITARDQPTARALWEEWRAATAGTR